MVLQTIQQNQAWIRMEWKCSYIMQWPNIIYVAQKVLPFFENPEVLAGNKGCGAERVNPADRPETKELLVIRGYAKHLKGKMSITFTNNTSMLSINIPRSLGLPSDYESLAKTMGQFVDMIELQMYAPR